MSSRQEELSDVQSYIKDVDKEVTMILQSLQWDRKLLLKCKPKSTCKYDLNHRIPPEKIKEHEEKCALKSQGYVKNEMFLPDVLDHNSNTVLKLSSDNIKDIIEYASKTDLLFKKGDGAVTSEPLTVERLQATYTVDERRAIYDVVISSRPSCEELSDLALGKVSDPSQTPSKPKSKMEKLAELRNLRRRRTKYRVAVGSTNYSHTLRELIDTQMEIYIEAQGNTKNKSHEKSDYNYSKVNEKPSNESLDDPSDNNTTNDRCLIKIRSRYDNERINKSVNERKRDHYEDRSARKFGKVRYQPLIENRNMHDNDYRSRGQERNRNSDNHYDRNRRYNKKVIDKSSSLDIHKYGQSGRLKNQDKVHIKEERDRSSSNPRDSRRYLDSGREEHDCIDKDRVHIKEERDRSNSNSRDNQIYRGRESEKQNYNKDMREGNYNVEDRSRNNKERDRSNSKTRDNQRYHGRKRAERNYNYNDRSRNNEERDRSYSNPRHSNRYHGREREERNYNDKNRSRNNEKRDRSYSNPRHSNRYHGREREERNYYDKNRVYIKEERDRSNSNLRDSQRYHDREKEERNHIDKDRVVIKEERDRSNSNSRDSQRCYDGEREEQNYNDKDRVHIKEERDRSKSNSRDSQIYHDREKEERNYIDKDRVVIKEERDRSNSNPRDSQICYDREREEQNYNDRVRIKEERDRSNSNPRDSQICYDREREEQNYNDRVRIKEERDRSNSNPRDSQKYRDREERNRSYSNTRDKKRYREREKRERIDKDKDRYSEHNRSQYNQHYNGDRYKKGREHYK